MTCTSSPENSIFYRYDNNNYNHINCYEIHDNQTKSFYDPEENITISSCLSLHQKYIKENTNECVDMPDEGYFISNTTTGLISPCNESCQICSKAPNETNQNCDSCKHNLFLHDGNCVTKCDNGYYLSENLCFKCHDNCETCTKGSIIDSSGILNMNYKTCKNQLYNISFNDSFQNINNEHKMIKNDEKCFPIITYNDYQIVFDISEIDSEIRKGTCLYFNKSIYYGEYESRHKPNNTFYILCIEQRNKLWSY